MAITLGSINPKMIQIMAMAPLVRPDGGVYLPMVVVKMGSNTVHGPSDEYANRLLQESNSHQRQNNTIIEDTYIKFRGHQRPNKLVYICLNLSTTRLAIHKGCATVHNSPLRSCVPK